MVNIDRIEVNNSIWMFRPDKGYYLKGSIRRYKESKGGKKLLVQIRYTKNGKNTKYRLLHALSYKDENYIKQDLTERFKFGNNFYCYRSYIEMLLSLNKWSYNLCNHQLQEEIKISKTKNSIMWL